MSPTPTPLPEDIERALPRSRGPRWETRLLRLVEPHDPDASQEPEPVEPPESAPLAERITYWQERATWATTADQYDAAVRTLARLRSSHREAGEPPPAPPAAIPAVTRKVLHREILERDSSGAILRTKEWTAEEPLPATAPPNPAVQAPGHETAPEIARPV